MGGECKVGLYRRTWARRHQRGALCGKRCTSAAMCGLSGPAASGERKNCTEMPRRACTRGRSLSRCAKAQISLCREEQGMPKDAHQIELTACLLRSDRFMTVVFLSF